MEHVKNVNWDKIRSIFNNAKITKPSKKKPSVYELVSSFDIETTSFSKEDEHCIYVYMAIFTRKLCYLWKNVARIF